MIQKKWIQNKRKNKNYKGFVGNPELFDDIGIIIFNLLKRIGLKQYHKLLDIGCGSLRVGRFLIHYLEKNNYYGIEPEKWLIDEVVNNLLTEKYIKDKGCQFNYNSDFDLDCFNTQFDFILANSIFIHASKSQIEKCIENVKNVLKPGGIFIFNFIIGVDNINETWTYPSHVKYSICYITELLEKYNYDYKYVKCEYPGKQIFIMAMKEL